MHHALAVHRNRSNATLALTTLICLCALLITLTRPAHAYVEIPYTLGRLINEATNIMTLRLEKVDKANRRLIFSKVTDLKGKHPANEVKHVINNGFEEREWKTIMNWAEPGKIAVFFHNGGAGECMIDGYWYQIYPGEWWSMSHAEPYLGRSFHGKPEKLAPLITAMLAGQEVIVPAMVDGDKNALKTGTAKIQRLKASLKIVEYNPAREFVGWGGNDEFQKIVSMPGFTHQGQLPTVGPGAAGIAIADFDGDGKSDLCLYGEERIVLLQNAGNTMNEIALPYSGPTRGTDWADYNGDGKPDLLIATPTGPRLFTNTGNNTFRDDSRGLPVEQYYNCTAARFIDADGDKRPDILLANGFMGLRLYRNLGPDGAASSKTPKISPWHLIGPFDNRGGQGFDKVFEPEKSIDLSAELTGKDNRKLKWQQKDFPDGQVNSLALFEDNSEAVAYVYRELDFGSAVDLPASFGSDDSLKVFLNGKAIIAENVNRAAAPDQHQVTLNLKPGKNQLLIKVGQGNGEWAFYFATKGQAQTSVVPLFEDVTDKFNLGTQGIGGSVKGDRLLVHDINGDGRDDFLYAAGTGLVALSTGSGFTELKESGIRFLPGGVSPIFADVTGDGRADLIVPQSEGCRLFANTGSGRFADITLGAGDLNTITGKPTSVAVAIMKKGEPPALIVGCLTGPNRYLRNNGFGKFADATDDLNLYARIYNTRSLWAGDLSGKATMDLIFNNEGQDSTILIGDPNNVAMKE